MGDLQETIDSATARRQEIRLTCLQIVLGARGPNYGNALGIVADAAALADYVMNGVNPAGHSPPEPKSDPTAVAPDDMVEELKSKFKTRIPTDLI